MAQEVDDWDEVSEPAQNESSVAFPTMMNVTYCKTLYNNETVRMNHSYGSDFFCPVTSDTLLCWPPTLVNQTAIVKCFSVFRGILYDDTQNATRFCHSNATWSKTNYSNCVELKEDSEDFEIQSKIYFTGYTISFFTLLFATAIFTYFKELRCLRNTIHMNLMFSYMMYYLMWILVLAVISYGYHSPTYCIFISTALNYTYLTTFFWMFVEGLYLYILVVETLTRENCKLRVYMFIGWGLPLVFILIWATLICVNPSKPEGTCPLSESTVLDWIYQAPIAVVLILNLLFLTAIMWVLITKLRAANTVETQQYHKAAKALLVLMPLLGITYVITVYYPTPDSVSKNTFEKIRSCLLSIQGFTVALFYCFLNTEVQNTVRHHLDNWKTRRSLGTSRNRSGSRSKDWSPRSRTESIRLSHGDECGPKQTNSRHNKTKVTDKRHTKTVQPSSQSLPQEGVLRV